MLAPDNFKRKLFSLWAILSCLPKRQCDGATSVITLSDSFKGNPRRTFELSINWMASKICLSNDIVLKSCSTPRSFFEVNTVLVHLKVIFDAVFCVTLSSVMPPWLLNSQLSWRIKLTWSDRPSLMACQPFGSSKDGVLRKVETVSVL